MSFGITTGKTVTTVLPGDGWWPDLALSEFLTLYRLPAEYAEELLADHLNIARLWAIKLLMPWRAENEPQAGGQSLEQFFFFGIQGAAALLFKRAVYCRAKALLLQQFATVERREAAKNDAKDGPETAEYFLAQAQDSIATLTGRTFIGVELI